MQLLFLVPVPLIKPHFLTRSKVKYSENMWKITEHMENCLETHQRQHTEKQPFIHLQRVPGRVVVFGDSRMDVSIRIRRDKSCPPDYMRSMTSTNMKREFHVSWQQQFESQNCNLNFKSSFLTHAVKSFMDCLAILTKLRK